MVPHTSLIDAANQAGANIVGGLSVGLQNPEPLLEQALTLASKQATAQAAAIAAGLGSKLGAVLSAQEGFPTRRSPWEPPAPEPRDHTRSDRYRAGVRHGDDPGWRSKTRSRRATR